MRETAFHPAQIPNVINSKPVLRFNGLNQYLFRTDDLGIFDVEDQEFTSFIVYRHSGTLIANEAGATSPYLKLYSGTSESIVASYGMWALQNKI